MDRNEPCEPSFIVNGWFIRFAVCKETPCSKARGLIVGSYANSSLRQASGDLGGEIGHGDLDLLVAGHVADRGDARGDLVGP